MGDDRGRNEYARDRHRAPRSGRSRSRSPRRRRPESRDRSHRRGAEKYRYIGGEQLSREAHGDPEHREKTRWDVGDPERGREQNRSSSKMRIPSLPSRRYRERRDESPISGRHDKERSSSKRRSRSRSRSSSSDSPPESSTSYHQSSSRRKERRSSRSRLRKRSSSSSSRSSLRSRSRDRHYKSKDKDSKSKKRNGHKGKEKRKKSCSPERRSVLTGKKIKMKVRKTAEDHERDVKREELLKFLNSTYN